VSGGHLAAVGPQIGVGKEADVFAGTAPDGSPAAIKLHRLGRTSFRAGVRAKRDYATPKGRVAHSWLHLSRLAATKEAAFMGALHAAGFAVPALLAANRHAVLMTRVVGMPLYRAVRSCEALKRPARVYAQAVAFVEALAARGLVHCDLNEFNLMVREKRRERNRECARAKAKAKAKTHLLFFLTDRRPGKSDPDRLPPNGVHLPPARPGLVRAGRGGRGPLF